MAEAQEKLAELAEDVMKTMIESENVRSIDIRDMRVMQQQIELGTRMAKEENYAIPVLVADELTNVQLKIVRGKRERGRVDIMFETPKLGKVSASFQVQKESVRGYLVSDSPETIEKLKNREGELQARISQPEGQSWEMHMICSDQSDFSNIFSREKGMGDSGQTQEEQQVQTRMLYGVARAFLEEVKQTGNIQP